MALRVHMTVEGKTSGLISEACSRRVGREDTVELISYEQVISMPRNEEDGRVSGHSRHDPHVVIKEIDRSSVLLQKALVSAEQLTVTLQFYRHKPDGAGGEEHYYTVVLEEATVVDYKIRLLPTYDAAAAKYAALETVGFSFTKITATFETFGIEYSHSLNEPV